MRRRKRRAAQALVAGKTPKHPVVLNVRGPDSLPIRLFGLGLAGMGAAHFTAPAAFDSVTEKIFPDKTRRWTYRNGANELLIGLAVSSRRTRSIGGIGLVAYVAFLAGRANRDSIPKVEES
jgi:uncharacterized membrane protein